MSAPLPRGHWGQGERPLAQRPLPLAPPPETWGRFDPAPTPPNDTKRRGRGPSPLDFPPRSDFRPWGVKSRIGGPQAPWSGRFKGVRGEIRNPPGFLFGGRGGTLLFSKEKCPPVPFGRGGARPPVPPCPGKGSSLLQPLCTNTPQKHAIYHSNYNSAESMDIFWAAW